MNIKEELLELYSRRISDFQQIQDACENKEIAGALLMSPNESYAKQPFPLLIVGQETNGWEGFSDVVSKEECEELMFAYEKFNVGKDYYATPFWNIIRKIETVLGNELYSCAWTNISKYDQKDGRPDEKHKELFSTVDNLLIDEIKITKPTICLFFIGHDFDDRLENIFEEIEFIEVEGFDIKTLCQLKHPNLPLLTFRTYHPNYLRRSGIEESVIDFISKQTKK